MKTMKFSIVSCMFRHISSSGQFLTPSNPVYSRSPASFWSPAQVTRISRCEQPLTAAFSVHLRFQGQFLTSTNLVHLRSPACFWSPGQDLWVQRMLFGSLWQKLHEAHRHVWCTGSAGWSSTAVDHSEDAYDSHECSVAVLVRGNAGSWPRAWAKPPNTSLPRADHPRRGCRCQRVQSGSSAGHRSTSAPGSCSWLSTPSLGSSGLHTASSLQAARWSQTAPITAPSPAGAGAHPVP